MNAQRTTRRTLLKQAGIGSLAALGTSFAATATDRIGPMKITRIDAVTFRKDLHIGGGSTSPHTCGGPLLYMCSTHLSVAVPNFLVMESNYWKYTHQFPFFVNNVPVPKDGHVAPPELPGIGATIRPELFHNGDAIVETVAAT